MANLEFLSIGKCAEILKDETFEYNGTECVVVSDAEECYRQGYKDAIYKACEWLEDNLVQCWIEDFLYVQFKHREHQEKENVLADFKKHMEE